MSKESEVIQQLFLTLDTRVTLTNPVALNGNVVPRAEWPNMQLAPGDAVEIVLARQGG